MLGQKAFPDRGPQVVPVTKSCKGGVLILECVGVDKWQKTSIWPGILSVMASRDHFVIMVIFKLFATS